MKNKLKTITLIVLSVVCLVLAAGLFHSEYRRELSAKTIYALLHPRPVPAFVIQALIEPSARVYIPFQGILGGTPGFYNSNSMKALDRDRIIAAWEDGHTGGYVILRMTNTGGQYRFEVLDSYLDR